MYNDQDLLFIYIYKKVTNKGKLTFGVDIDMAASVAVKTQGWLILPLQLICSAPDHPTSTHSNALYLGEICVCVCFCPV